MITALMFAAFGQVQAYSHLQGFVSYGPGPAIGYSCPAFLSVGSGAAHAVTAYVADTDLYRRFDLPHDLQTFNGPQDVQIWGSFGSGSVLASEGWVETRFDDSASRRWCTWSIKAPEVAGDETLITYDCFVAKDLVPGARHDADTPLFTTVVQVDGSDAKVGSGQSR